MSLLAGSLTPAQACGIRDIGQRSPDESRYAARFVSVRRLRQLDFRVEHTPQPFAPEHVSAYWDQGEWDARVAGLFCRAFAAHVPEMEVAANV